MTSPHGPTVGNTELSTSPEAVSVAAPASEAVEAANGVSPARDDATQTSNEHDSSQFQGRNEQARYSRDRVDLSRLF